MQTSWLGIVWGVLFVLQFVRIVRSVKDASGTTGIAGRRQTAPWQQEGFRRSGVWGDVRCAVEPGYEGDAALLARLARELGLTAEADDKTLTAAWARVVRAAQHTAARDRELAKKAGETLRRTRAVAGHLEQQLSRQASMRAQESVDGRRAEGRVSKRLRLSIDRSFPVPLSSRVLNALKREGVETVAELQAMTPAALRGIRNMGAKSVEEIRKALSDFDAGPLVMMALAEAYEVADDLSDELASVTADRAKRRAAARRREAPRQPPWERADAMVRAATLPTRLGGQPRLTFRMIGRIFGVSTGRVGQILKREGVRRGR